MLAGAALSLPALSACRVGPVAIGQPEAYSPPPPGIDEQYRRDAVTMLTRTHHLAQDLLKAPSPAPELAPDTPLHAFVLQCSLAAAEHGEAMRTGAENEQTAQSASPAASTAAATDGSASVTDLITALTEQRALLINATVQVSGSLARLTASIGAWSCWALSRAHRISPSLELPAPPTTADVTPTRPVPTADPAYIDPQDAVPDQLTAAQEHEWFAAYALEVLAARSPQNQRSALTSRIRQHRRRAADYGTAAAAIGSEQVAQKPVYDLPGSGRADEQLAALSTRISEQSLTNAIRLSSLITFEQRAPFIAGWASEGGVFGTLTTALTPEPGLAVD